MTTNTMQSWNDGFYAHTTPEDHPNRWKRFIELDMYNDGPDGSPNRLEGYRQMVGGNEYGSLIIETVNGQPAPQYIICTPKLSYPFNKHGHWIMSGEERIWSYSKLDGSNIFQYVYRDANGTEYTTFKLRTRSGVSARFQLLLDEALKAVPDVRDAKLPYGTGFGYELYGYKNPHIIVYKEPIALALLFARKDGLILGPHDDPDLFASMNCPIAEYHEWSGQDVEEEYRRRQEVYTKELTLTDPELEYYTGSEGEAMYVQFSDGNGGSFTRILKLKNHVIENIHWRSDRVAGEEIKATARNMWEVDDNPTVDDLKMLLAEDWTDLQIATSAETIQRIYDEVMERRAWQDNILDTFYQVSNVEEWVSNPGNSMRALSATGKFNRSDMTRIFGALRERVL